VEAYGKGYFLEALGDALNAGKFFWFYAGMN
jgi:hypothetical protein